MAMGNFCYWQGIECKYANSLGDCKLPFDKDICEMTNLPVGIPSDEDVEEAE